MSQTKRTNKTKHQLKSLNRLREKHRDQVGKRPPLETVSQLGKKKPGRRPRGMIIGKTFSTTLDELTPAGMRHVFGQLYSFFFLMLTLLLLWIGYRAFFDLPIWFDEGVAKALVFGIPVVWFVSQSQFMADNIGLDQKDFFPGLFLGLAVGGLYGFAGLLLQIAAGQEVVSGALFATSEFWWLAFLGLLTSWWESLFFFGLPVSYVRSIAPWFSEVLLGVTVVVFFLLFHAPLRLQMAGWDAGFLVQSGVLALFAIGQYLFYLRTKNMYALVLSQLLWGLVIEIYAI